MSSFSCSSHSSSVSSPDASVAIAPIDRVGDGETGESRPPTLLLLASISLTLCHHSSAAMATSGSEASSDAAARGRRPMSRANNRGPRNSASDPSQIFPSVCAACSRTHISKNRSRASRSTLPNASSRFIHALPNAAWHVSGSLLSHACGSTVTLRHNHALSCVASRFASTSSRWCSASIHRWVHPDLIWGVSRNASGTNACAAPETTRAGSRTAQSKRVTRSAR